MQEFKLNQNWKRQFGRAALHNQQSEKKRTYDIKYKKAGNNRTVRRKIDPLKLNGNLMIAFDHKRDAVRSFKLERISEMSKIASGFVKRAYGQR